MEPVPFDTDVESPRDYCVQCAVRAVKTAAGIMD
jgi:hypothetical protein